MPLQPWKKKFIGHLLPLYGEAESRAVAHIAMEELQAKNLSMEAFEALAQQWLEQLIKSRPIQYVTGKAHFYKREFFVNEYVLIPRPETEELAGLAIELLRVRHEAEIIDVGTGSGCLPITLAKELPGAKISAVDISSDALEVARKNARDLDAKIVLLQLDFLHDAGGISGKYDLIISNPPYIPAREKELLNVNVTRWEPHVALFVPDDDHLIFYRHLSAFAARALKPDGYLLVECHQAFSAEIKKLFEQKALQAELLFDWSGNARFVKAQLQAAF